MIDYLISRFNSFSLDTRGLSRENFADRTKKDFFYYPNSDTLIVSAPSWGGKIREWQEVKRQAKKSGASFLAYEFPRQIFSANQALTVEMFQLISETVRADIKKLKENCKLERVMIIGISLGSSYGSMIYKDNLDITDIVLVCPGNNLAQNMWHGVRTQHFRKSYERQGVSEEKLKESWHDLASENNMPAPGTRVTILYGKYDAVIPYFQSKTLADTLRNNNFKVTAKNYPLGHYLTIFNFLTFPGKIIKDALT